MVQDLSKLLLKGIVVVFCLHTFPLTAQVEPTTPDGRQVRLADIRIELQNLDYQLQILRWELVQSDNDQLTSGTSDQSSFLAKIDEIELEIRTNINRIEELEFQINQNVADARMQINGIMERIDKIDGEPPPVETPEQVNSNIENLFSETSQTEITSIATTPQEDLLFGQAVDNFINEDYQQATLLFGEFIEQNPSSERNAEAYFYRGEAYAKIGDWQNASKAFLESFILDGSGPRAPSTLYRLGQVMGEWERLSESCLMFQNLIDRFPTSLEADNAKNYLDRLECETISNS